MKFVTTLSATALACASLVSADSQPFFFLSIRSASQFQYANVFIDDDTLYLGTNAHPENAVITDDGYLKYGQKFVGIDDDGFLEVVDSQNSAKKGFSVSHGYLRYNDQSFYASKDDGKFALSTVSHSDSDLGIAIRAQSMGSDPVPDFPASNQPSSTQGSASQATPSAAPSEAPKAQGSPAPGAIVSQIGDGQIQAPDVPAQSSNGAAKQGLTFGAGIMAAAALLL